MQVLIIQCFGTQEFTSSGASVLAPVCGLEPNFELGGGTTSFGDTVRVMPSAAMNNSWKSNCVSAQIVHNRGQSSALSILGNHLLDEYMLFGILFSL